MKKITLITILTALVVCMCGCETKDTTPPPLLSEAVATEAPESEPVTEQEEIREGIKLEAKDGVLTEYNKLNIGEDGKLIIAEGTIEIADSLFACDTDIKEVVLPESLQKIGAGAFASCINLNKINFPEGLKEIGDGAFSGCSVLSEAILPDSLETLGVYVFDGCKFLSDVRLPASIKTIPELTFRDCVSLRKVENSATEIGPSAFYGCTRLCEYQFLDAEIIGDHAFYNCAFKEIYSDNIKSIGDGAFLCCKMLSTVRMNNSELNIGSLAFCKCETLSDRRFNIKAKIHEDAFSWCPAVNTVTALDGEPDTSGEETADEETSETEAPNDAE